MPATEPIWEVAALVRAVGEALQDGFGAVTVRGELAGFTRAASGHSYFNLRAPEGEAGLRCAMFRRAASMLDFTPRDGQQVELRGRLAIYEPRGELQMIVEAMRPAGEGRLMEQFLRLKAKLQAEGLFDASRRRPVPAFVRRVAVVTSPAAAALHDVLSALARRAPQVEVILCPAAVQGAEAPAQLVRAIAAAGQIEGVELLIVCRGGGSLEDLWAFNDERVVRAIAASAVPVICGVGHETDTTLADFAADLRAPTPTAAAELAAPPREDCLRALQQLARRMQRRVHARLDGEAQRLDRAGLRLSRPADALHAQHRRLALLVQRHAGLPAARLAAERARLALFGARLAALDPQRVLARGYALLEDDHGRPLLSVDRVQAGASVGARLADGRLALQVTAVCPRPAQEKASPYNEPPSGR
ncbi:exodeoxyribonuclease VII large subunit [Sphaerotilus natans subsp. natans DSM 6575]|uniref:Exodeoxyribonuclease 7 large subunit n=1 Tax=Sphaerotilus natans subsp. natans DSM 6575 TaxID=1286631 RepID=A0A059KRJ4_9BURK|nr:exodeoxyribonuclease VII large subunit [Sphaerotilus natans]KDB54021.1 exodeoxyribonuclease VII large subunit [Sphaerotilus natans subsp. natans DSM 6575]SIS05830.1 Exodeoxyribonuclease VII large subunit [Sphaerotilus natans]